MSDLLTTSKLLFANAVGCIVKHHGHDPSQPLPGWLADAEKNILAAEAERDRLREALESIKSWSEAYPLNIFREPDLNEAHRLLMAGGITLDAVSASTARHVVKGVGEIASAALAKGAD